MLDRLAHRYERNSVALAIDCLEQAARECGGFYEGRKPRLLLNRQGRRLTLRDNHQRGGTMVCPAGLAGAAGVSGDSAPSPDCGLFSGLLGAAPGGGACS